MNAFVSFYREVLPNAWRHATARPLVWLVAVCAGVLQTGGLYDLGARLLAQRDNATLYQQAIGMVSVASQAVLAQPNVAQQWRAGLLLGQRGLLLLAVILLILAVSVLAQGMLTVFMREPLFKTVTFREALEQSRERFWSLVQLNLITLGGYALLRVILDYPLSLGAQSVPEALAVFGTRALLLAAGVLATAVHMFALPRIMMHAASAKLAVKESFSSLKLSWLSVLELGVFLFVLGWVMVQLQRVVFFVGMLPPAFAAILAAVTNSDFVFIVALIAIIALFVLVTCVIGGLVIAFQYAAWLRIAEHHEEGKVVSVIRGLVHRALDR